MSVNTSPLNAREFWIHIITAFSVAAPMSTSSRCPAAVVDRRRPRTHIPTTAATKRRPVPITTKASAALGAQCVAYPCGATTTRNSPAIATTAVCPHFEAVAMSGVSPTSTESSPCTRIPENGPLCRIRAGDRRTLTET